MISTSEARADTGLPSASKLIAAMSEGSLSASQLVEQCLSRIRNVDGEIRAFVEVDADGARSAAAAADAMAVVDRGRLNGLPVAVKEVFDVSGLHCGWGSPIHRDRVPSDDAEVVDRLRSAGAIVVGTTVSTEFAIAAPGPTVNPHDHARTPGGSSSGPAAAVAAGMVPVAIGSQTVGSVVRPAAYCGIFGLKPTLGAIPGRGGMVLSPRLDHPGIFARSARDLPLVCQALFGRGPEDKTGTDIAAPAALPDVRDIHVLVSKSIPPDPVSPQSESAAELAAKCIAQAGATIEPFNFPRKYDAVFDTLHTIMTHDMAAVHGEARDRHGELMSDTLRSLIDHGRTIPRARYDDAVAMADDWRGEFEALLGSDAVLLTPAAVATAPLLDKGTGSNRPQALWSLLGLPVIAAPVALHEGLPLAVQMGAGPAREACVIALATLFEGRALPEISP